MLPTTRTAVMLAFSHTADKGRALANDAKCAVRAKRIRASQAAGALPPLSERCPTSTAKGRTDADTAASLLAGAFEDHGTRNNARRDMQLPRIARSLAAGQKGKCTPDMLESLLAYFQNPTELAGRLLIAFLPVKVGAAEAKGILQDHGISATDTEVRSLIRSINPGSGRAGGRPRKVRTVSAFGQGHKRTYHSEAMPAATVPSVPFSQSEGWARGFGTGAGA